MLNSVACSAFYFIFDRNWEITIYLQPICCQALLPHNNYCFMLYDLAESIFPPVKLWKIISFQANVCIHASINQPWAACMSKTVVLVSIKVCTYVCSFTTRQRNLILVLKCAHALATNMRRKRKESHRFFRNNFRWENIWASNVLSYPVYKKDSCQTSATLTNKINKWPYIRNLNQHFIDTHC